MNVIESGTQEIRKNLGESLTAAVPQKTNQVATDAKQRPAFQTRKSEKICSRPLSAGRFILLNF